MFKKAMMAFAALAAATTLSVPAEAHRDRGHTRVVVSYGSPGYYGGYYQPVHYRPRYRSHDYYYQPRYHYRPRYRYYDHYYLPQKRHWKKRHWRKHYRHW